MTWVRRGWTVLAAVLGVLLLGPAYAWATHEHATGCWLAPSQDSVRCWIPGQDWTAVQRLDLDLDAAGVYGSHVLSYTSLTVTAQPDGSRVITGTVFGYGPARSSITHARLWADVNRWDDPVPAAVAATEATYPEPEPDPSPSPSPEPSPEPEPTPSDPGPTATAAPAATSTATCGTVEEPCVTQLDEQQYLGLALMTGTLLLVSLTSFLLRHGRALRV